MACCTVHCLRKDSWSKLLKPQLRNDCATLLGCENNRCKPSQANQVGNKPALRSRS